MNRKTAIVSIKNLVFILKAQGMTSTDKKWDQKKGGKGIRETNFILYGYILKQILGAKSILSSFFAQSGDLLAMDMWWINLRKKVRRKSSV